jgi:hypothetical protein
MSDETDRDKCVSTICSLIEWMMREPVCEEILLQEWKDESSLRDEDLSRKYLSEKVTDHRKYYRHLVSCLETKIPPSLEELREWSNESEMIEVDLQKELAWLEKQIDHIYDLR